MRLGLQHALAAQPGIEVLAMAEDGDGAIALALQLQPKLVVMDIGLSNILLAYFRANSVLSSEQLQQLLLPQPGARQDWGLGHILYAPTGDNRFIVGHDGNNLPALCHTLRINLETGNGIVLTASGNPNIVNQLGNDWLFGEIGKLAANAQYDRLLRGFIPALGAIALGLVAIARA